MREIKFKGKRVDNGEWVYGDIHKNKSFTQAHIHPVGERLLSFKVMPETVCEFTGLKDKNGVDIYEGDKVKADGFKPEHYNIEFIEGGFCLTNQVLNIPIDINILYSSIGCQIEVIGNIHEVTNETTM